MIAVSLLCIIPALLVAGKDKDRDARKQEIYGQIDARKAQDSFIHSLGITCPNCRFKFIADYKPNKAIQTVECPNPARPLHLVVITTKDGKISIDLP